MFLTDSFYITIQIEQDFTYLGPIDTINQRV